MLKIRLKRTGKKHEPHYRVVVMEHTKPRDSKSLEDIGYYNPRTKPSTFEIDEVAAKKYLANGAQPTQTVAHYLVKLGLMNEVKKGSKLGKQKPKKKEAKEEA